MRRNLEFFSKSGDVEMESCLKREFEKRLKVWNLKVLAERLVRVGRGADAWTVRQVLDLISSNWRTVADDLELEVNNLG